MRDEIIRPRCNLVRNSLYCLGRPRVACGPVTIRSQPCLAPKQLEEPVMKKLIACGLTMSLVFALVLVASGAKKPAEKDPSVGKLRHVVLFKFKDGTKAEDVKKVEDAFRALPSKIPTIKDFEFGTNNSPEGLANGFTHCFFLTFDDDAGRAVYLPHPAHKAFGGLLGPHLDKVLVVDYVVKK